MQLHYISNGLQKIHLHPRLVKSAQVLGKCQEGPSVAVKNCKICAQLAKILREALRFLSPNVGLWGFLKMADNCAVVCFPGGPKPSTLFNTGEIPQNALYIFAS